MSSKVINDIIHWPAPILTTLPSRKIIKMNEKVPDTTTYNKEEYDARQKRYDVRRIACEEMGFGRGAVVAQRYLGCNNASCNPTNWGIVYLLAHYHNNEADYKPIKVDWINGSKQNAYYEMNELFLIHGAIPDDELKLMLQAQEKEMRDAAY